jgi:hypothetical protein
MRDPQNVGGAQRRRAAPGGRLSHLDTLRRSRPLLRPHNLAQNLGKPHNLAQNLGKRAVISASRVQDAACCKAAPTAGLAPSHRCQRASYASRHSYSRSRRRSRRRTTCRIIMNGGHLSADYPPPRVAHLAKREALSSGAWSRHCLGAPPLPRPPPRPADPRPRRPERASSSSAMRIAPAPGVGQACGRARRPPCLTRCSFTCGRAPPTCASPSREASMRGASCT